MAQSLVKLVSDFNTTLALKVAVGDTTATLTSATDDDGVALPTGTYGFTIDRSSSSKEFIQCTLTGTALTNIKTVARGTGVATTGFARTHRKGAEVIISDFVAIKRINNVLDGTTDLDSGTILKYDGTVVPVTANDLATKSYVDATATGTTSIDRIVVAGNGGEVIAAGNLVYLLVTDGEWYKCDADTAATVDNIILGIAQGAGTDGGLISGGILLKGLDSNQTGLTNNTAYYASNTAGSISSTPGTVEVSIGIARSTTSILFYPRYNQQITEDQQDALAGDSGTPSSTNKYVTQKGFQTGAEIYGASSAGTDTYAITITPAITAYVTGMQFRFLADVANTGAATLNVSGLGPVTIKKNVSTDLAIGDILAGQIVVVEYDGTNFQMSSSSSGVSAIGSSPVINTTSTIFETSARFALLDAGSGGTQTFGQNGLRMDTTVTTTRCAGARATINSNVFLGSPVFSCTFQLAQKGTTGSAFFGLGLVTVAGSGHTFTNTHAGFKIVISGSVATLSATQAESSESATSLGTITDADVVDLYMKVNGSSSIDYYWRKNGGAISAVTNIATNMPTTAKTTLQVSVSNDTTATENIIDAYSASYSR